MTEQRSSPGRNSIIEIQINIAPGKTDSIFVSKGDIPQILALDFCTKNNLDRKFVEFITSQISSALDYEGNNRRSYVNPIQRKSADQGGYAERSQKNRARQPGDTDNRFLKVQRGNNSSQPALRRQMQSTYLQSPSTRSRNSPNQSPDSSVAHATLIDHCLSSSKVVKDPIMTKAQREQQECSFSPEISPKSAKMMKSRRSTGYNAYEGLYNDALARQERFRFQEQEKTREMSFKMNTKLGSKATIDYKTKTGNDGNESPTPSLSGRIFHRELSCPVKDEIVRQVSNQNTPKLSTSINGIDWSSFSPFYRSTKRQKSTPSDSKSIQLDTSSPSSYASLASFSPLQTPGGYSAISVRPEVTFTSLSSNRPEFTSIFAKPEGASNTSTASTSSPRFLQKAKSNAFLKLFRILANGGMYIIPEQVSTGDLDPACAKLLEPFFEEMKDLGLELDFEEFYDAMEQLLSTLEPSQKKTLLNQRAALKRVGDLSGNLIEPKADDSDISQRFRMDSAEVTASNISTSNL